MIECGPVLQTTDSKTWDFNKEDSYHALMCNMPFVNNMKLHPQQLPTPLALGLCILPRFPSNKNVI